MPKPILFLLILFALVFSIKYEVIAQSEKVGNVWQISTGFNQSVFPKTILGDSEIEGGAGCSVGVLFHSESSLAHSKSKLQHFQSLGVFYDLTNFQLRSVIDRSSIPLMNLHIASLQGWQGLNIYFRDERINFYLKGGMRFQYVFSVNAQATDILEKQEITTSLFAAGVSTGMRYNRTALEVEYFNDINQVFKTIEAENSQLAIRIVYYFL